MKTLPFKDFALKKSEFNGVDQLVCGALGQLFTACIVWFHLCNLVSYNI